jgi:hypothetical protein
MLETALIASTTYFATIGPADVAALFAALTPNNTPAERRAMAIESKLIATIILLAVRAHVHARPGTARDLRRHSVRLRPQTLRAGSVGQPSPPWPGEQTAMEVAGIHACARLGMSHGDAVRSAYASTSAARPLPQPWRVKRLELRSFIAGSPSNRGA